MTVLITGAAGFIGFHVARALLDQGHRVLGLDSLNPYYDVTLKEARLAQLQAHKNFSFEKIELSDAPAVEDFFKRHLQITHVIHLAAQAGVRYSLENPLVYGQSNLMGYLILLEGVRRLPNLKHFIYASSSSVYGRNEKLPFAVSDRTDKPVSLYAATKRANELMGTCYSHLYQLPSTGLRFFTVYGPWGRPDMSSFLFTKAILGNEEIRVFNHGNMRRNFTYIADVVSGVVAALDKAPGEDDGYHRLYNLGNDRSNSLMEFIETLEKVLGQKARLRLEPFQPGDVKETVADITESRRDLGYHPQTNIEEGLSLFVEWYKEYYPQP